jgi:signal transduction histidine kinase
MTRPLVAGWVALNLALLAVLSVAGWSLDSHGVEWTSHSDYVASVIAIVVGSIAGATAAVRVPRNPVGWLVLGVYTAYTLDGVTSFVPAWLVAVHGQDSRLLGAVASLEPPMYLIVFALTATAMLLCPDGRLPGPRWRAVAAAAAVLWPAAYVLRLCLPSGDRDPPVDLVPHRVPAHHSLAWVPIPVLILAQLLFLVCAASLVARYRRADAETRRQLRWVLLGSVSLPLTLIAVAAGNLAGGHWTLFAEIWGLDLVLLGVPLSLLLAMTRYRLYAVDAIVDSAVAWAAATVVLVALFAATVLTAGVLADAAGSPVAVGVATALALLAARPVHGRLQRWVNRRFHRRRADAVAAVEAYVRALRDGAAHLDDLEPTLRRALGTADVAVSVPSDGGWVRPDGSPPPTNLTVHHVRRADTVVGRISCAPAVADEPGLLDAVGRAALLAIDNARLQLEARTRLAEVNASRRRIVSAGYAERRRLERDLHDGAQQRLVAAALTLRLAAGSTADSDVRSALESAGAELDGAIRELRELARGLHPPVLSEEGFAAAVESVADRFPLPVEVDIEAPDLPPDVAAAAYFVVCEALTNAAKYAHAERLRVGGRVTAGRLCVEVADDGRGGALLVPGHGLAGVTDRVEGLGGRLALSSGSDGTRLRMELPCAPS